MAVLDFLDSSVFSPVNSNEIPLVVTPSITAICEELYFAIKNDETIFVYGDYDMDGFCCSMVWREVLSLLRVKPPVIFKYVQRQHNIDIDIIRQVEQTKARIVIICDTGSSSDDRRILDMLHMMGRVPIVIDHHVFDGDYELESQHRLIFNTICEKQALGNCEVSGAYASLLVCRVLCERYFHSPLAFNAKVYALASMYSDCVDMSSVMGRALYNAVATAKAEGPMLFSELNSWGYLYSRRFFSYIVAPKINSCFRSERFSALNLLFSIDDKYFMKDACKTILDVYKETRQVGKSLVNLFDRCHVGEFVICSHIMTEGSNSLHIRNFTGIIATRIAQEEMSAVIVVVKDGNNYVGSYRDFYNRPLLDYFKLFCRAGGHEAAFGVEFSDMLDFKRHVQHLNQYVSQVKEKPYIVLNSGVIESPADYNALALYNEYMNTKCSVVISHSCNETRLVRSTLYNKYYTVGLPGDMQVIVRTPLTDGMQIVVEPAICRGVELRGM